MSKTRVLKLYTSDLPCNAENVVRLLENAGWSLTDRQGNITVWDTDNDEWILFSGSRNDLMLLENCCFHAFYNDICVNVFVNEMNSFDIVLEPKYSEQSRNKVFDFNLYYDLFVNRINQSKCVIERMIFEEY